MEKSLFEQMGGTYYQQGDYLLPNLSVPGSASIGAWGQRRRQYLREYCDPIYTALLLSGELDAHLAEIGQQAGDMFSQLVAQMSEQEGVTERLKADCQMEWVGHMNNIRDRATEIVNIELIFT